MSSTRAREVILIFRETDLAGIECGHAHDLGLNAYSTTGPSDRGINARGKLFMP